MTIDPKLLNKAIEWSVEDTVKMAKQEFKDRSIPFNVIHEAEVRVKAREAAKEMNPEGLIAAYQARSQDKPRG